MTDYNAPYSSQTERLEHQIADISQVYFPKTGSGTVLYGTAILAPEKRRNAGWGRLEVIEKKLSRLIYIPPTQPRIVKTHMIALGEHQELTLCGSTERLLEYGDDEIKIFPIPATVSRQAIESVLIRALDCIDASLAEGHFQPNESVR